MAKDLTVTRHAGAASIPVIRSKTAVGRAPSMWRAFALDSTAPGVGAGLIPAW